MTADILREKFLEFFRVRLHKLVESDSLVPADDPTVLFTPAGMNQFKREFLGFDSGFKRAATAQRCLRTDDLDKVGKTTGHHTFFEMLGNFSFGDYFKDEAISWAWEFLVQRLEIDKDKLWVSVYKDDQEAYSIWKDKVGVSPERILKLGDKDNFWPAEAKEKGPNGPCGPCSEIFFDFGKDKGCGKAGCTPLCECGRFVEIWNLVFTQYNRKEGGVLEPLPNKNIDTGMGLERLTAVMQGKANNFETDLFQPIIKEILNHEPKTLKYELIYAIADHIRAVTFCVYDGVWPSNDDRGYVVRKIIRKSVLHLRELGINKPFLNKLVPVVAQVMHIPYPDLLDRQEDIAKIILAEEKSFSEVRDSIKELTEKEKKKIQASAKQDKANGMVTASTVTSSAIAISVVRLYDTNGLPIEETLPIIYKAIRDEGIQEDVQTTKNYINVELNKLKELSKSQSKMKGEVFSVPGPAVEGLPKTQFLGYDQVEIKTKVLKVMINAAHPDMEEIVLDKTVFYPESGGQVGDTGKLINAGNVLKVVDTQKTDDVIVHIVQANYGSINIGDEVVAKINIERRLNIAKNHTATHILQAALRKVLGTHVQQQGSLVGEDKFRFDFTHFKGLSKEEIARIEEVANNYISCGQVVSCKVMALKEAKIEGALAFFEEKYGEHVRVVGIEDISKELCGGTHIDNIAKIGLIKIISEGSVASGIRRIEGVTAGFAEQFVKDEQQKAVEEAKKMEKLKELKEEGKKRSLEVNNSLKSMTLRLMNKGVTINGINLIVSLEAGLDMNALRLLADKLKEMLKQGVVALGSQDNEQKKAYLVVALTQDLLSKGLDAETLIRQVAPIIGGSGGGRVDFAQAGGDRPQDFPQAFNKLKEIVRNIP